MRRWRRWLLVAAAILFVIFPLRWAWPALTGDREGPPLRLYKSYLTYANLPDLRRAFPDQQFSWADVRHTRWDSSLDGSELIWFFGTEVRGRKTKHCDLEEIWDGGVRPIRRVKACLLDAKIQCGRQLGKRKIYRALEDGSLIASTATYDLHRKCVTTGQMPPESYYTCSNRVLKRIDSPARDKSAYAFVRNCGRDTRGNGIVQLSVMPLGQPPRGGANAFALDLDYFLADIEEGYVEPEWMGRNLKVRYDAQYVAMIRKHRVKGAGIFYVNWHGQPVANGETDLP